MGCVAVRLFWMALKSHIIQSPGGVWRIVRSIYGIYGVRFVKWSQSMKINPAIGSDRVLFCTPSLSGYRDVSPDLAREVT